jgi:nucleotide-binding universal stress UspA family protein
MRLLYLIANQTIDEPVVHYATQVAKKIGASLHILVVTTDEKLQKTALEELVGINESLTEINFQISSDVGDPVDAMNAALEEKTYEMVLMGVPRRRRVIPSQFRFISHRIIKSCSIPIMLIRRVSESLERILVCTSGKEISKPVVDLSTKLAGAAKLQATLLYVAGAVPSMYTGIEGMDESLENLLETDTPLAQHLRRSAELLSTRNIPAEIKVKHGDVVGAILEEVDTRNYDLIVLGESSEQALTRLLLGNVTQQIINRAASAVLIVK